MTLLDTSFTLGDGADAEPPAVDLAEATDLAVLADLAAVAAVDDAVLPSELVLGPPAPTSNALELSGATADVDEGDTTRSAYARCADGNGTLTHLFFSDDEFDIARAKAICSKYRLAPSCLSDALDRA